MKKIIFTTALMIASFAGFSQVAPKVDNSKNPNAAEMTFEKEVHDYGTIMQGADGNYEFKFKNTGKEPLIVNNAKGSCGCTVPSWPKEPIKPGGSGVIKVTYDTKRVGAFSKTVMISTNSKTTEKVLTIKGTVNAAPAEETFPGKKAVEGATPLEK